METMTSSARLKKEIELLEVDQAHKWQQLKRQFYPAFDSLRPANLFKSTLNDITSSPVLVDNMIGTVLGLATGYFSKRMVVGASVGLFRKVLGSVIQFGVTNTVARHTGLLKSIGGHLFQGFFKKRTRDHKRESKQTIQERL